MALPAQVLTTLYSFDAPTTRVYAALIQATDGNLYGTSWGGGPHHQGTVFKLTPGGATLHAFCPQSPYTDGAFPYGALVQATNGDFYGTTASGGSDDRGTVFKITPSGTLTTLHSFWYRPGNTEGSLPYAGQCHLVF
jgi:uncharacterized repeat protein (TIGR03803 family)